MCLKPFVKMCIFVVIQIHMGAFDYTTNGVTMPAHSCKTASGGVWLREDMS